MTLASQGARASLRLRPLAASSPPWSHHAPRSETLCKGGDSDVYHLELRREDGTITAAHLLSWHRSLQLLGDRVPRLTPRGD